MLRSAPDAKRPSPRRRGAAPRTPTASSGMPAARKLRGERFAQARPPAGMAAAISSRPQQQSQEHVGTQDQYQPFVILQEIQQNRCTKQSPSSRVPATDHTFHMIKGESTDAVPHACLGCFARRSSQVMHPRSRPQKVETLEITGSSIKRVQEEGALPVQVITRQEIERRGFTSAEQLVMSAFPPTAPAPTTSRPTSASSSAPRTATTTATRARTCAASAPPARWCC